MPKAPDGTPNRWVVLLLFPMIVVPLILLLGSYAWVSGKPITGGMIIGPLVGFSWVFLIPVFTKKSRIVPNAVPEPIQSALREDLRSVGVKRPQILYAVSGESAEYPRPFVTGSSVSVSTRVLQVYSPEALRWSVKTDVLASKQFTSYGAPLMLLIAVATLIGTGLCERFHVSGVYYSATVLFLVLGLVGTAALGFYFQVLADRKFTRTETDRRAAKEALGYAYFAQKDRKAAKRWLFFPGELLGRAKRLGIELERDYRASEGTWDEVSISSGDARPDLYTAFAQVLGHEHLDA